MVEVEGSTHYSFTEIRNISANVELASGPMREKGVRDRATILILQYSYRALHARRPMTSTDFAGSETKRPRRILVIVVAYCSWVL